MAQRVLYNVQCRKMAHRKTRVKIIAGVSGTVQEIRWF